MSKALERRIARKDRKIAGLQRRIALLERQVAGVVNLPKDIHRAVQDALCNVRMIPVHGIRDTKILDVRWSEPEVKK